jgi:hypothetical protein
MAWCVHEAMCRVNNRAHTLSVLMLLHGFVQTTHANKRAVSTPRALRMLYVICTVLVSSDQMVNLR